LPKRSTEEVVTRFLGEIALMREFPPHVNVVKYVMGSAFVDAVYL
jgi:hypothetical protein